MRGYAGELGLAKLVDRADVQMRLKKLAGKGHVGWGEAGLSFKGVLLAKLSEFQVPSHVDI